VIVAKPLSVEGFAPYGDVVSAGLREGKSANQGTAVRFDWCAALETTRDAAKPNLAVFRSIPKALPFEVKLLERHPCSTQMFVPMKCGDFLVVVCPGEDAPDLTRLEAFICGPGQGFNYRRGLWHHPIIALDTPAEFIMLAWEDGSTRDCEERPLSQSLWITK
jgi:ureidoglycolate lyase